MASIDPHDEIGLLREELAQLRAELAQLRGAGRPPAGAGPSVDDHIGRRDLLRRAGYAAAGVAAAGIVVASQADRADAASGDPVYMGKPVAGASGTDENTADKGTQLRYTLATNPVVSTGLLANPTTYRTNIFSVTDRQPEDVISGLGMDPAAIGGYASQDANAPVKHGVVGHTRNSAGYGVWGVGNVAGSIGARAEGVRANLLLNPSGSAAPLRADTHGLGELICDSTGELWLCVAAGTGSAAKWRKVSGPTAVGSLHLLSAPVRAYDSRIPILPTFPTTPGQHTPGSTRLVSLAAAMTGIPVGATAVVMTLSIVGRGSYAYANAFAGDVSWPGTVSVISQASAQEVSNDVTARLDANRAINLYVGGLSNCDLVVDVNGYYR